MVRVLVRLGSHIEPLSGKGPVRYASVAAATESSPDYANAKPFSQIPGPKPLPIPKIGNFWRFLPFGTFGNISFYELQEKLHKDYGPIVKFTGVGRPTIIMINDPEDAETIFRNEGKWPIRPGADAFDHYRRNLRRNIYGDYLGVGSTQGEEWQKNRTIINQPMMKPQNVKSYHEPIQKIASEFVQRMKDIADENQEMPADFHNEINKWSLESIGVVALDSRLGCLEPNLKSDSDAQMMINTTLEVFDLMYNLEIRPSLWRYLPTPDYKRFVKLTDVLTSISMKHIDAKLKELKGRKPDESKGVSVLEVLLKGEGGKQVAMTMAMDMLMAGIDTTSNSVSFALYFLAKHPKEQEKLYKELKGIMPNKEDVLPKDYGNLIPYLKSCIKETQRLTPIAIGNFRSAGADMVLRGYQIPRNTDLMMGNMLMSREERHFKNPLEWTPERWLKSDDGTGAEAKNAHPFVFMPFGFGPRMCVGRRFAELEMHAVLAKVIRNFRVSYDHGELKLESKLLLRPGMPLKFKIEERPN